MAEHNSVQAAKGWRAVRKASCCWEKWHLAWLCL